MLLAQAMVRKRPNPEIGDTFKGRLPQTAREGYRLQSSPSFVGETETGCLDDEHSAAFQRVPVGARTDENLHLASFEARLAFGAGKTQVVCA